jgi:hypothetical protein
MAGGPQARQLSLEGATATNVPYTEGMGVDGTRFNNLTTQYSMLIDSEDGTGWIGVDFFGRAFTYTFGGDVVTIAGPHIDPTKFSFASSDDQPDNVVLARCLVEGTFTPSTLTLKYASDLCLDIRDHKIVYIALQTRGFVAKVDRNFTPVHVSVYCGQPDVTGYADGPAASALFGSSPCVEMLSDGTLIISDSENGAIRAVSPDGSTVSTVAGGTIHPPPSEETMMTDGGASSPPGTVSIASTSINYPYWIAKTSHNTIVFVEGITQIIRELDLLAGTVRRVGLTAGRIRQNNDLQWACIDCDRNGVCGTRDKILIGPTQYDYIPFYQIELDGSNGANMFSISPAAFMPSAGKFVPIGGYAPWSIGYYRTENRLYINNVDHPEQMFISYIPYPENVGILSPAMRTLSIGWWMMRSGSCSTFPLNCRPAFSTFYGDNGASHLGLSTDENTFDDLHIKYPTDEALGAFIQGGMLGSVPRPEITGNDLRNLIYWIRRGSYAGSYPTPVSSGPDDPDTGNFPTILTLSVARISSTSFSASWTTNKPCIGFVGTTNASQASFHGNHQVLSPIESGYSTTHRITLTNLAPISPVSYIVVARDMAGNVTYTSPLLLG